MAEEKMTDNPVEIDKKTKKSKKEKKKKNKDVDPNLEEEETVGGKIVLFLVTLIIILVWLAIFGILIKFDVGGFGSTVLYPILKDVPVVNQILPDVTPDTTEDLPYDTLEEAITRIKELEKEIEVLSGTGSDNEAIIADLQSQVEELKKYKEEQANFEALKEKFYEEVVFSDEAPDISEYRAYYESIDPENAAVLYKQVVEQEEADAKITEYAKTYSAMKAKDAAEIFNTMTDDLKLVAKILQNMSTQSRSDILAAMDADTAAKLTEIMEP